MVDPAFATRPAPAWRAEDGSIDYEGIRRAAADARSAAMAGLVRRVLAAGSALLLPAPPRHRRARPVRLHRPEEVL
ncbi:hypothetical protein [Prosthecomicrobium sp. N25]|uniref:hypothetical protein n=1 Tax=Prosthecomicrobium sp. N25 TaxID=3129254 RepID=UPI003076A606